MTTAKGGQKLAGSVKWRYSRKLGKYCWMARFSLPNGKRTPYATLNPNIPEHDREAAKAAARVSAQHVRATGGTPNHVVETIEEYAKRWHTWREGRGLSCVKDDRARMINHVFASIGPLDVRTASRRDLERLVESLDERIAKGTLGWKVALMAWSNVARMFKDACSAKRLDLRVRDDNPADNVQAPERGVKKQKQYLWPSEFLALIRCPKVLRRWRVLFALAVYTYARAGEIAILDWSDVSFDANMIHIHRSRDAKSRKVKSTKTGVSRRIPIEAELLPLLKALHDEVDGKGKVVAAMPSAGMLSRKLKHYLGKAGVKRSELFAKDATRKAITFHDLRATGITWMAARGDDPLRIKQRAGYATFSTTEGYIREAENLGASFGQVFPALPDLSRGSVTVRDSGRTESTIGPKTRGAGVGAAGLEPATSSV